MCSLSGMSMYREARVRKPRPVNNRIPALTPNGFSKQVAKRQPKRKLEDEVRRTVSLRLLARSRPPASGVRILKHLQEKKWGACVTLRLARRLATSRQAVRCAFTTNNSGARCGAYGHGSAMGIHTRPWLGWPSPRGYMYRYLYTCM